ncbi:MAG TPA: DUF1800 domain-containing protein [Acidothermaceae bacterium]|nr:DUF1800 domain-containing protein [Acidothermaceae bacterium]
MTASDALRSDLAHLYRRAGFGATPADLDAAVTAGYAATVAALVQPPSSSDKGVLATPPPHLAVAPPPAANDTAAQRKAYQAQVSSEGRELSLWWLDRMVMATNPFPEKLTFFWHGHFATAMSKVRSAALMLRQNELLRTGGLGAFDALDLAIARDPAMMIWLDENQNIAGRANENFARENMELFTLGYGNYSEDDVREGARCYTGWRYDQKTDAFMEVAKKHDNGVKTVLGHTGNFDGGDLIKILTHSDASYRWISTRVWCRFAKTITTDPVVNTLMTTYSPQLNIGALMTATFTSPLFLQTKGELVKQPVEYVVGALRALKLRAGNDTYLGYLQALGQVPFEPPNVGGWPFDDGWLTTAASYTRMKFARYVASHGDISAVADEPVSSRADAAAQLLSVDGWGAQTRVALAQVAHDPESLMTLALCAPEYVVN